MKSASVALAAMLALLPAPAMSQTSFVLPPSAAVAGGSQSYWSQIWWQWAWSFAAEESPVRDETGELCASGQVGDVWFLAGTYGTKRTIRKCKLPYGKYIFLPLINYVVPPSESGSNCLSVMSQAARLTESPTALLFVLNEVKTERLETHRQATIGCFDLGEKTKPRRRITPTAANGYYIMLRPLPRGTHSLNFGGVLPGMIQAVTYTLVVE
jgi:hypothetical protein